jgi:hypothetical protein
MANKEPDWDHLDLSQLIENCIQWDPEKEQEEEKRKILQFDARLPARSYLRRLPYNYIPWKGSCPNKMYGDISMGQMTMSIGNEEPGRTTLNPNFVLSFTPADHSLDIIPWFTLPASDTHPRPKKEHRVRAPFSLVPRITTSSIKRGVFYFSNTVGGFCQERLLLAHLEKPLIASANILGFTKVAVSYYSIKGELLCVRTKIVACHKMEDLIYVISSDALMGRQFTQRTSILGCMNDRDPLEIKKTMKEWNEISKLTGGEIINMAMVDFRSTSGLIDCDYRIFFYRTGKTTTADFSHSKRTMYLITSIDIL